MKSIILILLLIPQMLSAQLNDDFSDGNFTGDPAWSGTDAQFMVNSGLQLQLGSTGESTSYLSTQINSEALTEWRIWAKLSFSPSDNNNARIYLMADQANISEPLNGYYLQLGEGGSADAIELIRQSGTVANLVCRGTEGFIAASFAIRIRVVRSDEGTWSIYADPAGGEEFQLQATGEDPVWESYSHFGVLCKYTSSNATKFFFDDIYAGPAITDHIPPALISVEVTGQNGLDLLFSETVEEFSAANTANYSADQGLGHPMAAGRDPAQKSIVQLLYDGDFMQGVINNLSVNNLRDIAGNVMEPASQQFVYYEIQPYDVVINEIMADPDPPVGLPNHEHIELYNRTDLPIQLENWELRAGTSLKVLTRQTIAPKAYLILTSDEAAPAFTGFGPVMEFPSLSLANTGTSLVLCEKSGAIVHALKYDDTWYHDAVKKEGGWSLEQIDPSNPCGGSENWRASNNPAGGSPGSLNSINASNPDTSAPDIEKISITGPSTIKVFFTEMMDSLSLDNPQKYTVDQGLGSPLSLLLHPPDYRSVSLTFPGIIAGGTIYTLSMATGFTDCAGNNTETTLSARFAVPSPPGLLDVVINEVLYDPLESGTDFVEIYNRSDKVIDLKDLWLSGRDALTGDPESVKETAPDGRLMFPGEYLVLSDDSKLVQSGYFSPSPNAFLELESMPPFPNEHGSVVLLTQAMLVIDEFAYNSEMQFALLSTTDGVSLERVNYNKPASDAGNWHSASQNVGFATPGYQNSQFMRAPDSGDEIIITPEIFSPDNDGYNDLLSIACNFVEQGLAATIRIFDSNGRPVRLLVKNEPAGTGNMFTWDGITDDHEKAPIGIYIVHVEVFNLSAKVKQFKKTAVLGGKL